MEPRAADEWFHCKVLNILWRHFYVLYECRPWKIVVDLFFTITFIFFFLPKTKTKKKKTARRGYSHRPQLLTNQRARIRSVIVKSTMEHNLKMTKTLYSKHIRELQKKSKATHMNGKQPFEHWFCPNTMCLLFLRVKTVSNKKIGNVKT